MLNFTIGPVMSSDDIIEVANHSTPYFRTPEFSTIMKENEAIMLELFKAPINSRCIFLTASGTGAMESVVMNVLNSKDEVLVINGGSFGQRFADLCNLHNRKATEIKLPFGHQLSKEQLNKYSNMGYTALLVNMHETSSGVLYDIKMISDFCKQNRIMLIIDAISSFIADELDMSELGAAVVITGSQKALAVQPGVSIVALSPQALQRIENNKEVCMYLSMKEALVNGERGQTPYTPAVTILLQINKRLRDIKENGGIIYEREQVRSIAQQFRDGIKDLPLEVVPESQSNAVTCLRTRNESALDIFRILKDEYNIWICPNGGEIGKRVFRVGHIGHITKQDNNELIDAMHKLYDRGVF